MLFEKTGNRLGRVCWCGMRAGKKVAGILNLCRALIVVSGLLLGLMLMGPVEVNTQEANADGDLRLVDTTTGSVVDLSTVARPSGRLEIFSDPDGNGTGKWKGICDDGLGVLGKKEHNNIRVIGRQEAEVACRQLGFSGGTPLTQLALPENAQANPTGYYLLDDLECSGSEARILGTDRCKHRPRGQNNCTNKEAFGVTCAPATTNNDAVGQIAIRGTETKIGVTVTADHSGITDADGKPSDGSSFSYQWIRSDIAWNEEEIAGATASTYTFQQDDEDEWIKVRVSFTDDAGNQEEVESFEVGWVYPDLPDGSIRLLSTFTVNVNTGQTSAPSDSSHSGMLQIFDNNAKRWKGICDDEWDQSDAQVACRQLGLQGGTAQGQIIWLGFPPLLYLLDGVNCDGTENQLLECGHAGRGVHDCTSYEYAGVTCDKPSESP